MILSPTQLAGEVLVGNEAGWALTFHRETEGLVVPLGGPTFSSADYYAEIEATLPSGLEGGAYTFTIEGLTDSDYAEIAQSPEATPPSPSVVRLHLFWRDAGGSPAAFLESLLGLGGFAGGLDAAALAPALVAELAVTKVSRRLGARRYETVITGVERVHASLSQRLAAPLEASSYQQAALDLGRLAKVSVIPYLQELAVAAAGANAGAERFTARRSLMLTDAFRELGRAVEQATGRYGRGMFLIRDGLLHFGVRPIPLEGGDAKVLTLGGGLLEAETGERATTDPNVDPAGGVPGAAPERRSFTLTLKGRPDLKPGDLVAFALPAEDLGRTLPGSVGAALAGAAAGALVPALVGEAPTTTAYVTSVQHRLGRTSGFSTVLKVIEVGAADDGWDAWTPGGSRPANADRPGEAADGPLQAAKAIKLAVKDATSAGESAEVAEVRATLATGTAEPPGQTLTVWSGLQSPDGKPNQARRLDLERAKPHRLKGVPYATPFAWGKCGLVLPRYPGTRVVLAFRNGEASDPVDIGALWAGGDRPPNARAGDWWLILPAKVPANDRASTTAQTPPVYADKATNDLIDADGNRFVEVGRLTVRVGMDGLKNAGDRPADGDPKNFVAVEHKDGKTKILVKDDGTVEIVAAKNLVLDADEVSIKAANNITLNAKKVDVTVSQEMDVH